MNCECYRLTYEDNIRVLLNGTDGDSVISYGYEYIQQLFLTGKFFKLFTQITQLSKKRKLGKKLIFRNLIIRPFIDNFKYKDRFIVSKKLNVNKLIKDEFASATNLSSRIDTTWALKSAKNFHKKVMESPSHTTGLELQNILASNFSIENRSPFYDKRVVEYCVSLPSNKKLHNGTTRYILREAMRDIIPEKNRVRLEKSNLSIAFCANLSSIDKARIDASLASLHPYLKNKINLPYLYKNWTLLLSDPYGAGQKTDIHSNIYTVFVLNAWLHKTKPLPLDYIY
jgi:asparagine synthase (glutamine-hydrolysing)